MTSLTRNPGQSDHTLMCKQWWRVCWMYGDQEKFYRQLYGRKNTSRAIVTSTSSTLTNDDVYSELCNGKLAFATTTNTSTTLTGTNSGRRELPHYKVLQQQGAYQELYGLGVSIPFMDTSLPLPGPKTDRRKVVSRRSAPELPIPTISSSVPHDNDFYRPMFNESGISGRSRFPIFPNELCNDMSVLAISPEAIREQDTLFRQKAGSKKRARNGERISSTATFTTTTMLTVEQQILTPNQ